MELARRILGPLGRGLELGGSAFNVFEGVTAWNLDYPGGEVFQKAQGAIAGKATGIDIYANAENLPIVDGALPFLLNSHVVEHMPDTIHALGEWDRCVRDGGVLFFIVPHKERTFDRLRPRTALQHHLADYAERMTVDSDPLVPTSHYHVWITEDFVALIEFLNAQGFLDWEILEVEDVDSKVGNGFTVVARKRRTVERTADGDRGGVEGPIAFHQLTRAFPFRVIDHSLERIALGPELPQQIDAPHGVYRVLPIHEGFPPRAGPAFELQIGDEVDAPVIEAVELVDGKAVFHGHALTESTWLEATYPDGTVHQVLPAYADGRLALSVEGLVLPAGGFPIVPVTPAPGGGRGPTFSAWTWDSLE